MVVGGNQSGKGAKGLLMGKAAAPVVDDKKDKKKPTSRSSRAGLQLDPNGRMCLTTEGYRRLGLIVRELADAFSGGRVLVVQEGGYQITYSAYCVHAFLEGLLDLPRPLLADPMGCYPEDLPYSSARIAEIRRRLKASRS